MSQNNTIETIQSLLQSLRPTEIQITDESHLHKGHTPDKDTIISGTSSTHIRLMIVSQQFQGVSMIQRHKMIYKTLDSLMDNPVHALAIKAYTPEEYSSKL